MSCPTGRCALRRFEGHGASNYRPTNPDAAREQKGALERLMSERARQDAGVFGATQAVPSSSMTAATTAVTTATTAVVVAQTSTESHPTYSLSDAK